MWRGFACCYLAVWFVCRWATAAEPWNCCSSTTRARWPALVMDRVMQLRSDSHYGLCVCVCVCVCQCVSVCACAWSHPEEEEAEERRKKKRNNNSNNDIIINNNSKNLMNKSADAFTDPIDPSLHNM